MHQFIFIVQIILAVVLIAIIILQQKGTGLGSTFGGDMGFYRTKRGAEKLMFYFTILVSFLFVGSSILGLLV